MFTLKKKINKTGKIYIKLHTQKKSQAIRIPLRVLI